jgi:hypothetical protein
LLWHDDDDVDDEDDITIMIAMTAAEVYGCQRKMRWKMERWMLYSLHQKFVGVHKIGGKYGNDE